MKPKEILVLLAIILAFAIVGELDYRDAKIAAQGVHLDQN